MKKRGRRDEEMGMALCGNADALRGGVVGRKGDKTEDGGAFDRDAACRCGGADSWVQRARGKDDTNRGICAA